MENERNEEVVEEQATLDGLGEESEEFTDHANSSFARAEEKTVEVEPVREDGDELNLFLGKLEQVTVVLQTRLKDKPIEYIRAAVQALKNKFGEELSPIFEYIKELKENTGGNKALEEKTSGSEDLTVTVLGKDGRVHRKTEKEFTNNGEGRDIDDIVLEQEEKSEYVKHLNQVHACFFPFAYRPEESKYLLKADETGNYKKVDRSPTDIFDRNYAHTDIWNKHYNPEADAKGLENLRNTVKRFKEANNEKVNNINTSGSPGLLLTDEFNVPGRSKPAYMNMRAVRWYLMTEYQLIAPRPGFLESPPTYEEIKEIIPEFGDAEAARDNIYFYKVKTSKVHINPVYFLYNHRSYAIALANIRKTRRDKSVRPMDYGKSIDERALSIRAEAEKLRRELLDFNLSSDKVESCMY